MGKLNPRQYLKKAEEEIKERERRYKVAMKSSKATVDNKAPKERKRGRKTKAQIAMEDRMKQQNDFLLFLDDDEEKEEVEREEEEEVKGGEEE